MDTITVLPGISFKILHNEIFPTTKKHKLDCKAKRHYTLLFRGDYSLDYNDVDDDDEKEKDGEKQKHDVEVVAND